MTDIIVNNMQNFYAMSGCFKKRQGGVLSTGHYKRYNNPLLLHLEKNYSGMKIGSISIPHITVADDLALLAKEKSNMQVMLWDAENGAGRERYCIHPAKSHTLLY